MIKTTEYVIPAKVIATGEEIMVNNPAVCSDNPWGFYSEMWHFDEKDNVYHDDELEFLPTKGGTVVPPSDFQAERPKHPLHKEISESFPRGQAHTRTRTHTRIIMRKIRVLIACEESQAEVREFRKAGCLAYSCDLQLCSGNHPEWHIVGDCLALFQTPCAFRTQDGKRHKILQWDLVISHPPCTYLSRAAGNILFAGHCINQERYKLGLLTKDFFMACYNVDAPFVVVENPVPFRIFKLPRPSCSIHPKDFGAPWLKQTLYWLKNLPPLMATIIHPRPKSYVYSTRGGKKRSKSFPEVAEQMVAQWLPIVRDFVRENNKTMIN